MSIRAVISVSMIVVIVLFAICLAVYVAVLSHRLEQSEAALEEAQALNVRIQTEIRAIRDDLVRIQNADIVLNDRIEQAANDRANKFHTLENDKSACTWLDTELPASVRDSIGAVCGRPDNSSATAFDGRVPKANPGTHGY